MPRLMHKILPTYSKRPSGPTGKTKSKTSKRPGKSIKNKKKVIAVLKKYHKLMNKK